MLSFILPTRNRPDRLLATLEALGSLTLDHPAEVVIADNASDQPVRVPETLANAIAVKVLHLDHNAGAAARNAAVAASSPETDWLLMLDDDSHPVETVEPFRDTLARLRALPPEKAAVMADIHLPAHGCRESGGLPEVFIGCGVAIRKEAFISTGTKPFSPHTTPGAGAFSPHSPPGYDPTFGYYAEEYDLAARFLARGFSITFDPAFRIDHHKVNQGRDMDLILERLARNNGWVMQRYAPSSVRRAMLREQRTRYRRIAEKEDALAGYARGLTELRRTIGEQCRTPLLRTTWDRFTGLAHARAAINLAWREQPFSSVALVEPGKNAWAVERALAETCHEAGIPRTTPDNAEAIVIGTLSPGPMLDGLARWRARGRRVIVPWLDAPGAGVFSSQASPSAPNPTTRAA